MLDTRRQSRAYFVIVLLLVTVAAAASELVPRDAGLDHRTAKIFAILPALMFGAIWMLRFQIPSVQSADRKCASTALSARDQALLARLRHHVFEQEAFRDSSLTIVSLAASLGASQHRLRALINQTLGHSNFSAFLNSARIDAVCEAMEHHETADLPILTLALDAGFKSLSSFNKAFKSAHGVTPSRYRQMLAKSPSTARNPSGFSRNSQDAAAIGN